MAVKVVPYFVCQYAYGSPVCTRRRIYVIHKIRVVQNKAFALKHYRGGVWHIGLTQFKIGLKPYNRHDFFMTDWAVGPALNAEISPVISSP
jgi:hypothetical protein